MERNMDTGAMVVGGLTSTGVLTRGQMARALREGALDEARSGGTGGGVIAGAISWVNVRKYINNKDLRTSCGGVTLAMLMAAAITVAPTPEIPGNSANVPSSGPQPAGSIPRTPSPSVGDGNSVHPYVSDVNQGQQKKMLNKITGVTAAAVVGIAATVAGAQSGAVQWRVEDGGNGHWYLLDSSRRPWTDADANAVGRGGHLVTVNAYAEHLFLRSSVFSYCCSMSDTWIGATRSNTKENYHWVTGEPFSTIPEIYFNNNRAGWDAPALYLEQVIRFDWVGEWGGESNSANEGNFSVIEWESDCNNDSIVDYGQCLNGTLPDYNGNNTPDCCERGEVCVVGNYPVQWRVEDGGNGHWYATSSSVGTWDAMRTLSIALGGDLASLQSMAENQAANRSRRAQDALTGGGPWIGGRKLLNQAWSWSDGSTWDFMNWALGEPCCGDAGLYVHLYPGGEWNDHNQTQYPCRALIEWSADCNNDGTVDYGQILRGELPDINNNGVPDTCEFADCNHDGIADNEQIARGQLADYDGNNIPDCCDRGEACVVGNYPVQWRTADGGNGHWYQATRWPAPKTWPDALASARELGGLLACATSAGENEWIAAHSDLYQPGCAGGCEGWHLGGYQDFTAADYLEPSGGWRWISGEPWSYTAWLTDVQGGDRPNNYGLGGEQYLKMSELPYAPRWDDVGTGNGNTLCGAILEWSADCNNDGTVDYGQILLGQLSDANNNGVPDTCEFVDCNHDGIADSAQVARGQLPDYDGNNIPDCCDRGEACVVGNYPVEWRVSDGGNGHLYSAIHPTPMPTTYASQDSYTASVGGYMATLSTENENLFAIRLLSGLPGEANGAFFGLRRMSNPVGWRFVDGQELTWNAWGTSSCPSGPYPNNVESGELVAELYKQTCGWIWDDTPPADFTNQPTLKLLVEWSADCNNDGTVDYGQILRGELPDINHNGTLDTCECIGDIYVDSIVNGGDLGVLLAYWGPTTNAAASIACDLNVDGVVNGSDLGILLAYWGPCSN